MMNFTLSLSFFTRLSSSIQYFSKVLTCYREIMMMMTRQFWDIKKLSYSLKETYDTLFCAYFFSTKERLCWRESSLVEVQ